MTVDRMDVIRRTLELAETAREGLAYVEGQNREGNFEGAFHVLTDVVAAFAEIGNSLSVLKLEEFEQAEAESGDGEPLEKNLSTLGESVQTAFRQYVELFEAQDWAPLLEFTEVTLFPRYVAWNEVLERILRPRLAT